MKIGIIADVHANLPALQAVLAQLEAVDMVVCAGDVVGYYNRPNEACELIRQRCVATVLGNHDAYVTGHLEPTPARRAAYRTDWTRGNLSSDHLAWLRALPEEHLIEANGRRVRIRHASPWDMETYLYRDSPKLAEIFLSESEILVLGHTHHPMALPRGKGLIINPGSVGQPRDYNPAAGYAIFDTETGDIRLCRAKYGVECLQRELRAMSWTDTMVDILSRTR